MPADDRDQLLRLADLLAAGVAIALGDTFPCIVDDEHGRPVRRQVEATPALLAEARLIAESIE